MMRPLFLLAPMNRSGTKFFKSLLLGHRAITQGFSLEDYSIAYSDLLLEYAQKASRHWGRTPDDKDPQRDRLQHRLGECLLDFFEEGAGNGEFLLLTTPRPWGLENIRTLFPDARLLIIVRDGRDCVSSACKAFSARNFRFWAQEWRRGADEIIRFAGRHADEQHAVWDFISFEKAVQEPESAMRGSFEFLGLPPDDYDRSVLDEMVIRGSSWHGGVSTNAKMTKDFNPVGRHRDWSLFQRLTFQFATGKSYQKLQELVGTSGITGVAADRTRTAEPGADSAANVPVQV